MGIIPETDQKNNNQLFKNISNNTLNITMYHNTDC